MRHYTQWICSILLILWGWTPLAKAQDVTVTEKDTNKTVRLGLGRTLTVRLAQTGGTGYRWTLSDTVDSTILSLASTDTQGKGADTIGGKAAQVFRYTGRSAGTTNLTAALTRKTGDEIEEAETFRLTVEVGSSSGVKGSSVSLSAKDNGTSVKLRVGEVITVSLSSIGRTNFRWMPDTVPIVMLQSVGRPQTINKIDARATITQIFRYRVLREGTGKLSFAFRSGFQKGSKVSQSWQINFTASR
jgi:predicted secreted protein